MSYRQHPLLIASPADHRGRRIKIAVANTYVTPGEAYRFARGIPIYHETLDTKVQIDRPRDFLGVTDHASNLGIDAQVVSADALLR